MQHLAITHDGRQQVVEIVGHPARQPPDGFHLLGLKELFLKVGLCSFRPFAFGNVPRNPKDRIGC